MEGNNGYLTSGDLALIENRRGYGYGYGYGSNYENFYDPDKFVKILGVSLGWGKRLRFL